MLLGTVFIGAIGSGVWEYILKPILEQGSNFILDIATLGIGVYKDNIYTSVAKGFSESNSIKSYQTMQIFMISLLYVFYFTLFLRIKKMQQSINIESSVSKEMVKDITNIELKIKKVKKFFLIGVVSVVILLVMQITSVSRLNYINDSISYYQQLKNIALPYMKEKEILELDSRFALIKNKNDYVSIINDLKIILKSQNLTIEDMEIW